MGIPSLFFPTVWHPPLLCRAVMPARPEVPGCHVTSLIFPRRELLARDLHDKGAIVKAGSFELKSTLPDVLDSCPLGVQVRKGDFEGACEVHRMQGWANVRPDIAWVSERGLDDDLWQKVFPNAVFCPTDAVVDTSLRILQDVHELQRLCEQGQAAYETWCRDWERGGLGFPQVLYDAIPWCKLPGLQTVDTPTSSV